MSFASTKGAAAARSAESPGPVTLNDLDKLREAARLLTRTDQDARRIRRQERSVRMSRLARTLRQELRRNGTPGAGFS